MGNNYSSENTVKQKAWKRALCVILSLIMAFGAFISITFGNILLSDYVNLKSIITANASESPTPCYYRHGELVGLYKTNYSDSTKIQYKIGEDGEWTDYSIPFTVPAFQTTRVYSRIGENGNITYQDIETTNKALGVYTEENTDFEFSYNNIYFGYSRIYNSADKTWFNSIDSKIKINNNLINVYLPDGSVIPVIKNGDNSYIDEINGYTLTLVDGNYIFETDEYKYYFANNMICRLSAIEDNNGNRLNFIFESTLTEYRITDGCGREISFYDYFDWPDSNGISHYTSEVTDPNGNKLFYRSDTDYYQYLDIIDQAGVTIGKYEYSNTPDHVLTKSNDKAIEYDENGRLSKITYDTGEYISYTYDDENKSFSTITSAGETTTTVYNDAFLPVEYTDEYGTTAYTYDDNYRIKTETYDGSTTTYTYDNSRNLLSYVTENDDENTYYTYDASGNMVREQMGDSYTYYTYDSNKNVLVSATLKEDYSGEIPDVYNSDLTCFDTVCYTYDDKGRVTQEQNSSGSSTEYVYDNKGNVTTETYTYTEDDETKTTVTTYTYDEMGNVLTRQCDSDTSVYTYDKAGRILLSNESGDCTRTLYDTLGRTVQEIGPEDYDESKDGLPEENTYSDSNAGHTYVYAENGNLTSEKNRLGVETVYTYHENSSAVKTESFDLYVYEYDVNGNVLSVKIAGNLYASYVYDDNLLEQINYGNGQSVIYEYNQFGQTTKQKYRENSSSNAVTQFEYTYAADAQKAEDSELISKIDYNANQITEYDGDRVTISNIVGTDEDGGYITELYYSYLETPETENEDETVTPAALSQQFGNRTFNTTYNENSDVCTMNGEEIFRYNYQTDDENNTSTTSVIGTVDGEQKNILDTTYEYNENGYITKMTTVYKQGQTVSTYVYDDNGNIIEYHPEPDMEIYYTYDSKNQLIREDYNCRGISKTVVYEYDARGNATASKEYPYTRGEITDSAQGITRLSFDYDNEVWLDKITNICYGTGRENILYDDQGNPVYWADCTINWTNGRQLKSITYTNENGVEEELISFTYDENGIRTSKTYCGETTYYSTNNGIITSQYQINAQGEKCHEMIFLYNSLNEPVGVNCDGYNYYYLKNAMGDVLGFVDEYGSYVQMNYYSAGGDFGLSGFSITESSGCENASETLYLSSNNPLRYRGYYYDGEWGSYYLQSRYYVPTWHRFFNADLPEYAKMQKNDHNGTNLFAYCGNDPVNNVDPSGYYSAKDAQKYAEKWWCSYNTSSYKKISDGRDCANFVSQCLYAGGLTKNMTGVGKKGWHHYKMYLYQGKNLYGQPIYSIKFQVSDAWGIANDLYKWLVSSNHTSYTYVIKKYADVDYVGQILKSKDSCSAAIFFDDEADNIKNHAAISGEIFKYKKSYDIYYYAHSEPRCGKRYYKNVRQYHSIKDYLKANKNAVVYVCILK